MAGWSSSLGATSTRARTCVSVRVGSQAVRRLCLKVTCEVPSVSSSCSTLPSSLHTSTSLSSHLSFECSSTAARSSSRPATRTSRRRSAGSSPGPSAPPCSGARRSPKSWLSASPLPSLPQRSASHWENHAVRSGLPRARLSLGPPPKSPSSAWSVARLSPSSASSATVPPASKSFTLSLTRSYRISKASGKVPPACSAIDA
mmetsp:Transcript_75763/g.197530  ORF Transcript_75763/g.197530 Transcript_75763/m.197530 type:complete len:202 (-) Transcript_75763:815-1420(-)